MASRTREKLNQPMDRPALLLTEDPLDYSSIFDEFRTDLRAEGAFQLSLVHDLTQDRMELYRLEGAKAAAINRSYPFAIANLAKELIRKDDEWASEVEDDAISIAHRYLDDPTTKAKFQELLERTGLNHAAIEAEAMSIAAAEVERYDRLISTLRDRLRESLRNLFALREAMHRHQSRLIEDDNGDE
jgi:hypothetical protein